MKKWPEQLGILAVLLCVTVYLFFGLQTSLLAGIADSLDYKVFMYQQPAEQNILIVALDNATLNNPDFKRYQDISREDYAKVVRKILKGGAAVVGVDVFFANPAERKNDDYLLSVLFRDYTNVIGVNEYDLEAKKFIEPASTIDIPPAQVGYAGVSSGSQNEKNLINRIELFLDPENPKNISREPFVFKIFRALVPGRQSGNFDAVKNTYTIQRGEEVVTVPLQKNGINVYFHGGGFEKVSFYDVWSGRVPETVFKDRIVLLGATAEDIHDSFFTPVSMGKFMPGVEIHANLLETMLSENFVYYQSEMGQFWLSLALVLILVGAFVYLGFVPATGVLVVALGGLYLLSVYLFRREGFVLSVFWPASSVILAWAGIHIWKFLAAERRKRELRSMLDRYVSPAVVDEILKQKSAITFGGTMKTVTVFFSDIRGFTDISEKLDAASLTETLSYYFDQMSQTILATEGTIDKYIGDAIMAFWGAPLPQPDHAFRACRVALAQQILLPKINRHLAKQKLPPLAMRIGIHTGEVVVGNVGAHQRMDYTIIGDSVNLGSRLEGINKQYDTKIILSEVTAEIVKKEFFLRELDNIQVKGKQKPTRIYELVATMSEVTKNQRETVSIYEQGLALYRAQKWYEAQKMWEKIQTDPPAKKMLERLDVLHNLNKKALPKNWDGVYTFTSK